MVHGKGRKGKPRVQTKVKATDGAKLDAQLAVLGLRIAHVTADGNCLFRATADQLEGNEEEHSKYRKMVVDYIENHQKDYEPFIEDEVPFDEYCNSMREDGTWAGHLELQAVSLVTRTNICIHRLLSPRWHIHNFEKTGTRTIHLSYHDGEHYNSVRRKDDDGEGPAKSIMIEADAKLVSKPPSKDQKHGSKKTAGQEHLIEDCIKLVMERTGCRDANKLGEVLQEVNGDVNAAIEFLIAYKRGQDNCNAHEDLVTGSSTESWMNGKMEALCGYELDTHDFSEKFASNDKASSSDDGDSRSVSKLHIKSNGSFPKPEKVARNKACPCGSKKKYKTCCGAVKQNSSRIITSSKEAVSNKARKERLRNAKSTVEIKTTPPAPENDLLDMGSLCI